MKFGLKNPKIIIDGEEIPLDESIELKVVEESNKPNEIEITMSDVNSPPKIKLNGKEIEGIVELEYKYVTESSKPGYHNFFIQYGDKETDTIRTASANKLLEG